MSIKVGELFTSLKLNASEFAKELYSTEKTLQSSSKKFQKIGRELSTSLSLPLGIVAGVSLKYSRQFETAFAGVRKVLEASESEFKTLEKTIIGMSKRMPSSAVEIAKVAEVAGQLGIKTSGIEKFTETMIMLGESSDVSADVAATAIARIQNVTKLPADEVDNFASVLVDLGNNFAATESEILAFTERIAPSAGLVGLSASEISAFSVALASAGQNAEASGTAIQKVLLKIFTASKDGGEALNTFARTAGMLPEKFKKLSIENPAEALLEFINGLKAIDDSGGNVLNVLGELKLNNERTVASVLSLVTANDTLNDAFKRQKTEFLSSGALLKEYSQRLKTFDSQWDIFTNSFISKAIEVGNQIKDILLSVMISAKGIADGYSYIAEELSKTPIGSGILALGDTFKQVAISVIGVTAVAGPLIYTLAKIPLVVGKIALAFKAFDKAKYLLALNPLTLGIAGLTLAVLNLDKVLDAWYWTWDKVGKFVGKVLREIKRNIIEVTTSTFELAQAVTAITGLDASKFDAPISAGINDLQKMDVEDYKLNVQAVLGGDPLADWSKVSEKVQEDAIALGLARQKIAAQEEKHQEELAQKVKKTGDTFNNDFGGGAESGSKKAADSLARVSEELNSIIANSESARLEKALDTAILNNSIKDIQNLKKELIALNEVKLFDQYSEDLALGGEAVKTKLLEINDQYASDLEETINGRISESLKEAHEEAVQNWSDVFRNAISGQRNSLSDMFKDLAIGFGSQLLASLSDINLTKALEGGMEGWGKKIGEQFLQGFDQNKTGGIFSRIFDGLFGSNARPDGVQGPLQQDGTFSNGIFNTGKGGLFQGANSTAGYISALVSSLDALSRIGKSSEDTTKGLSEGIGAGLGAYFGGPIGAQIGGQIGKVAGKGIVKAFGIGGPTNPETIARREAVKQLEPVLRSLNSTAQGFKEFKLDAGIFKNFTEFDASKFFGKGGSGEGVGGSFLGIGRVLSDKLNIKDLDAGQLGVMIAESMKGNVNELRALVNEYQISQESYIEAQKKAGYEGEISWLEVASSIRDANQAFGEGLIEIGNVSGAIDNYLASGGKGRRALLELGNVAVEAKEMGIGALEELYAYMNDSGKYTAEEVNAFREAFAINGIKSIEDLAKATEDQLINITASFDASLQDAGKRWESFNEILKETKDYLEEINNSNVEVTVSYRGIYTGDHPESNISTKSGQPFNLLSPSARGAVITTPTSFQVGHSKGLLGEAGSEAIMPLTNIGGKLGVHALMPQSAGKSLVVNVDARGAERGVHEDILSAFSHLEDRILNQVYSALGGLIKQGAFA